MCVCALCGLMMHLIKAQGRGRPFKHGRISPEIGIDESQSASAIMDKRMSTGQALLFSICMEHSIPALFSRDTPPRPSPLPSRSLSEGYVIMRSIGR